MKISSSIFEQILLGITSCWIAAEHALQHATNNISSVSKVFDKWKFQKSDYAVLAGFDESLVKSGVGYLEQIHVFVFAEVDPSSSLLTELGRLFSPFSSILFTESSSYRLPVFKDDGTEWEFDELVYLTVSKFADNRSSAKTPPNIISLNNQNSSSADGSSHERSGSGSGEGEENKKSKGKQKEMGDEADKNNNGSYDKPTGNHQEKGISPVDRAYLHSFSQTTVAYQSLNSQHSELDSLQQFTVVYCTWGTNSVDLL